MTNLLQRLSLCMIVKDEEAALSRCLKSVSSLISEYIIVDTGSKDSTVELAKSFGARVFGYAWDDDFSNARNFALSQATGDWILVLDADEVLVYDSKDQFDQLLEDSEVEGYFIRIINLLGAPPDFETSEDLIVRLFRNKPEYRFQGAIHEQVRPSIVACAGRDSLKTAPLTIYHDGYLSEVIEKKEKVLRNSKVISKALSERPADPFLLYSLGCEYFLTENFEKALEIFRQALPEIPAGEGYLSDLVVKMGLCLYKMGRTLEMQRLINGCQELSPLSPELLFLSGLVNLDTGKMVEAEQDIKECMKKMPGTVSQRLAIREYQVYQALGEIYEAKHSWDEALRFYFLSLQAKPGYLYPLYKVINIYRNHEPENKIDELFGFCPPETKCVMLTKLDWERESDIVIYLIIGLARDIMISDFHISKILGFKILSILNKNKPQNLRVAAAVLLAKAVISLAEYKTFEVGNSAETCRKIIENLIDFLLKGDPR